MSPDSELRELRDTLAIEIARELCKHFTTATNMTAAQTMLSGVYPLADAVLSMRDQRRASR